MSHIAKEDLTRIARTSKHTHKLTLERKEGQHSRIEFIAVYCQLNPYLHPVTFVSFIRTSKYLYGKYRHEIPAKKAQYMDERVAKRREELSIYTTDTSTVKMALFDHMFSKVFTDRDKIITVNKRIIDNNNGPNTARMFTREVKDESRVGDVYLAIYRQGSPIISGVDEMSAHCSLIIDTAGESTGNMIVGCEVHLGVDPRTFRTSFVSGRRETRRTSFFGAGKIAKVSAEHYRNGPAAWASKLITDCSGLYDDFIAYPCEGNDKWGARNNSRQYVKYLVYRLGIVPKSDTRHIGYIEDYSPAMIDTDVLTRSYITDTSQP